MGLITKLLEPRAIGPGPGADYWYEPRGFPSQTGVRVNAIAPGPVETAMAAAVHSPEIRADYRDAIPPARYGLEEELASAIFFLCSDKASYITGQTLAVDGGFDAVWTNSELFAELREPVDGGACTKCSHYDACRGGCMAAKFFTGLPANGPDPECVQGYGEAALAMPGRTIPRSAVDHSRPVRARSRVSLPLTVKRAPAKACNESPLG